MKTAVEDNERGMGAYGAEITEEAAQFIAQMAGEMQEERLMR